MRVLLVVYDDESYVGWFPQGLAYIAAVLKREGYEVEIYSQDFNHFPDEHLTDFLNKNRFDVVGVSVIAGYYQYRKLMKISDAINKSKNRPYYIIGGHGPSPEPEHFFGKTLADAIVIGEGEETIVDLLGAIGNKETLKGIPGIAYREGTEVTINNRRTLIKDIDSIPFPAYSLFPMEFYRLMRMPHATNTDFVLPILSGRGCTFNCSFCYRMDEGFRPRSCESIIEEVNLIKRDYGITYVAFGDELLMSSVKRTASLCEAIIKADLNVKWECNGRLNYAKPDVLKLMKKAGCVFINYGIEAMDDNVLKNMKKGLTTPVIIEGIKNTLAIGISPGFNIIFGNIGDNKATLEKGVELLLKYDDGSQLRTIRPVTPYPGSALYYYAIENGMMKDCEDFYENKHANSDLLAVNFTELSDDQFHQCLLEANSRLITNYFTNKLNNSLDIANDLYLKKNPEFRGFRQR